MRLFQKEKQGPAMVAGVWVEPVHFYFMGFHYWTENNPCSEPKFQHHVINDGGVFVVDGKRIGHNIVTPKEIKALVDHIKKQ